MNETPNFLTNLWYVAGLSASLKAGTMRREMICGEPVLLARYKTGRAFALRDICPHRSAPLSAGALQGDTLECPYHGWRFKTDGVCAHIPSLTPDQDMDVSRIRVKSYPLTEQDGLLWIYMPHQGQGETPPDGPPRVPLGGSAGRAKPRLTESQIFACDVDHAVAGLMDPAHGPFVHRTWWWRKGASIHAKAKPHVPTFRGFAMAAHKPSSNSLPYKLLGGNVTTEIRFELPALRFEHIRAGGAEVLGLTAVTPQEAGKTLVRQIFYWTMPWIGLFNPVLRPFARAFLAQDRRMVELQNEGLKFSPPQMLIQDADALAIWYHRLKKAWAVSVETGQPFENPVRERTLRWRS